MDKHLGASITLSFGLVVFFAIVLYQPEKPLPHSLPPVASSVTPPGLSPDLTDSPPPVTPGEPLPEPDARPVPVPPSLDRAKEVEIPTERGAEPIARLRTVPETRVKVRASANGPRSTGRIARASEPRPGRESPPHDAFTLAIEGETLEDVAVRVYGFGTSDEVEALWRVNRDLIGGKDVTLSAGTLLRTP